MRSVILLAPAKILLQHSEEDWLSTLGNDSLIFTDVANASEIDAHLPNMASALHFYKNFNENAAVELDVLGLAKQLQNPLVIALAEADLLRAARINDRLQGQGSALESATLLYRDKYLMKRRLAENGIQIAPMATVTSPCEINDFIQRYDYPVVVKPRDGRGSGGVTVIKDKPSLHNWLEKQPQSSFHNLMIEKFIDAPLLNVNGLYLENQPIIISPVRSTITCLQFLEGKSLGFQMLSRKNPLHAKCTKLTRKIIEQALPRIKNMLFHLEIFHHNNELIVCEIACRLGGCSVNEELREAFNIDARLSLIRTERLGTPSQETRLLEPVRLVGQLNIPPKAATLVERPNALELPFIRHYKISAKKEKTYSNMQLTNGEIVTAIVSGNDENEVSRNLQVLDQHVANAFIWK
ncbi:ATP-grasp domain-containing protein [Pseudomonas guariconensis]|uniref:ATP-grasp domain-containing protein n=1 Tax=Pseudomonas guariconensis TaxID=1288410 RepID=UPI0018AC8AA8|nr:ATP-grasp domain-containing protein [Pseudomonas guariconensis]MBF8740605.1 ATP-grasp domain-containing protein [Pseudomonas guariconensis]MBF8750832.1 ATP-grasp domain-containing protein [Pseudomonas guariconensis]